MQVTLMENGLIKFQIFLLKKLSKQIINQLYISKGNSVNGKEVTYSSGSISILKDYKKIDGKYNTRINLGNFHSMSGTPFWSTHTIKNPTIVSSK